MSDSSIAIELQMALEKFVRDTGRNPLLILLGDKEWYKLLAECHTEMGSFATEIQRFMGIEVLRVCRQQMLCIV